MSHRRSHTGYDAAMATRLSPPQRARERERELLPPTRELAGIVSESVWLRLGQGMARCLHHIATILRAGAEAGVFTVEDPDYTANVLWTQGLGAMHLARIRVGVRSLAPGVPALFAVE